MTLEIIQGETSIETLAKQKKVKIGQHIVSVENIKIGTTDGSGFIYCGKAKDFSRESKNKNKATQTCLEEIRKLQHERDVIQTKINKALGDLKKAEQAEEKWGELTSREVVEVYPSVSEDNTIVVLIRGTENGRFWSCGEE